MRMGWSKDDPPSIQWLAFASDTECDIMDVMTGHLVVLVYTLYIRHNLGVTFQQSPRIDGSRYPLFDFAMPLIQCGAFMKQGKFETLAKTPFLILEPFYIPPSRIVSFGQE
jgi:hypothetical protein